MTTATGLSDVSEVLFNHIDLLNAKLDVLHSSMRRGTNIDQLLESAGGKAWAKHCDLYCDAVIAKAPQVPRAPSSGVVKDFLKRSSDLARPFDSVRYAWEFCTAVAAQLKCIFEGYIADLDLRWNGLFTCRICQLLTQFCKTVIFIKFHPSLKYIVATALQSQDKAFEKYRIRDQILQVTKFVCSAIESPYDVIQANLSIMSERIARFLSSIGSFLARLLGKYPLVEWEEFSMFSPQTNAVTLLMSDNFLVSARLSMLVQASFWFFSLGFGAVGNEGEGGTNESFKMVAEAVLTESPEIHISPGYRVPTDEVLQLSLSPDVRQLATHVIVDAQEKFRTSHKRRMIYVTFHLQDVLNYCDYDPAHLPWLLDHVTALSGLAFYELEAYFLSGCKNIQEAMDLLTVVIRLAKLIADHQDDLQRYYVYNLATLDMEYLNQHITQTLMDEWGPSEKNIPKLLKHLTQALVDIDLTEYDQGIRYDFTGYHVTYGRILRIFNDIKRRMRIQFLDPAFEHLTVINNHILFAQNPVEAFLTFCPIHTFWCYHDTLYELVKQVSIGACASILHLYTYFVYDRALPQRSGEVNRILKGFPNLRLLIGQRVDEQIKQLLDPSSLYIRTGIQSHDLSFNSTFCPQDFTVHRSGTSEELATAQIESIVSANRLKQFCRFVPDIVYLWEAQKNALVFAPRAERTGSYFAQEITSRLSQLLFEGRQNELKLPTPSALDLAFSGATQFLWNIFASLGSSFPQRVFECRLTQSLAHPQYASFDGQIILLKGGRSGIPEQLVSSMTKLLDERFGQFFQGDWLNRSLYLPSLRGFWSLEGPEISQFFTQRQIEYIVQNLGLHVAARLDATMLMIAARSIAGAMGKFAAQQKAVKGWMADFKLRDQVPTIPDPQVPQYDATAFLVRAGAALQLRELIRSTSAKITGEAIPGISELLEGALRRGGGRALNEIESVIVETSGYPLGEFALLDSAFNAVKAEQKIPPNLNLNEFVFWVAVHCTFRNWDDAQYLSNYGAFTGNLHLIPIAVRAILNLPSIFDVSDPTILNQAFLVFFPALAQIASAKREAAALLGARTVTIIADIYARVLGCDYGRIEDSFPTRVINVAYSTVPPPTSLTSKK